MKILYDHQIFSLQPFGGISRYFINLIYGLKSFDNSVKINSLVHINQYLKDSNDLNKNMIYLNHKFKGSSHLSFLINDLFYKENKYSKNKQYDIFHETYYLEKYRSKTKGKFKVTTIHDMLPEKFPDLIDKNNQLIENKLRSIYSSDLIICVSENTQKDLLDITGVKKDKTIVIQHGISLDDNSNNVEFKFKAPYILYVGTRMKYKNFENLLIAYSQSIILKNNFKIVCIGGNSLSDYENNLLLKYKINNNVFHIEVDDIELANYYKNAHLFVFPSLYEGFGIPLIEAMKYNCPIVCSKASSFPEVVGDASFFFNPLDINSIKTAIEEVAFNERLRFDLIEKGRKQVQLFDINKTIQNTNKAYKNLLL